MGGEQESRQRGCVGSQSNGKSHSFGLNLYAGGAAKNRRFDGTITLPAGEYILKFESDGSHSFGDWNADPPDNPEAWGITIFRVLR